MKSNEYQCSLCGGVFESMRSDEEALAEAAAEWRDEIRKTESAVVCDDCFQKHFNPATHPDLLLDYLARKSNPMNQ